MAGKAIPALEVIAVGDELGVVLPPEIPARLDPERVGEIDFAVTDDGAIRLMRIQSSAS